MMTLGLSKWKVCVCVWAAAWLWQQSCPEEALSGSFTGDHSACTDQEDGQQVENCGSNTLLQSVPPCTHVYTPSLQYEVMAVLSNKAFHAFSVQELQQFEQYIFSDYSSFILVHNVYDDVLRNLLSQEIDTGKQQHTNKHTKSCCHYL